MKALRPPGAGSFFATLFFLFLFSAICVLLPLHARALAESSARASKDFVFRAPSDIQGWRFEHVSEARFTVDGIGLKGNNYVRIAPPVGFRMPARRLVMEVEFRGTRSIVCNVRARASNGWEGMKTLRAKILDNTDGRTRLVFYLGRVGDDGTRVQDFVVEFYSTENVDVRLAGIKVYDPTVREVASLLWKEFWRPDFVTGATVGFVTTPAAGGVGFLSMLYILMALAFVGVVIVCRVKGRALCPARLGRALMLVILGAGLVFALRMDYNWLVVWRDDIRTLSPVGVDERLRIVNNHNLDSFFAFIRFVKENLPPGEAVRPATLGYKTPLAAIARYYMLPLENSEKARFLWSYGEVLTIDPLSGELRDTGGRLIAPRARLVARFATNAALYEVLS